jgi:hypothetical protein
MRGREGVSAENRNPSSQTDEAGETSNHGVVTSHGEREKRAYVAPVEVPKRNQRLATIDMSKVRISPDMKVQQVDPRHMPTQKMDIPPGGIRPPPPPAAMEVGDPSSQPQPQPQPQAQPAQPAQPGAAASPWSQNAGIDRSMLPSAAMASAVPTPATKLPSMPPPGSKSQTNYGPAIWIGVVVLAALIGGGIAFALRSGVTNGGATDAVSSSAPIAITVPGTTATATSTASAAAPEEEVVDMDEPAATGDAGAAATPTTKTTTPRTPIRRTTKTTAPAPAPAPTSTGRPRLFN